MCDLPVVPLGILDRLQQRVGPHAFQAVRVCVVTKHFVYKVLWRSFH